MQGGKAALDPREQIFEILLLAGGAEERLD